MKKVLGTIAAAAAVLIPAAPVFAAADQGTLGDRMSAAAGNAVFGIVTVVLLLLFLSLVIWLFGKISSATDKPKKKKETAKKETPAEPVIDPVFNAAPEAIAAAAAKDEEIAAVIAAAIAAVMIHPQGTGYYVTSIKKSRTSRRWKRG